MTASTAKSDQITNLEAAPRTRLDRRNHGLLRVAFDEIEVATTSIDETADIILCGMIPTNARVRRLIIRNEDMDSNGAPALAVDVGLYYSGIGHATASGTVADADAFASAITTLQSANLAGTDLRVEATGTIDECGKEAWDAAGLSSDPGGWFYIGFTVTTAAATAAAGHLAVEVEYVA